LGEKETGWVEIANSYGRSTLTSSSSRNTTQQFCANSYGTPGDLKIKSIKAHKNMVLSASFSDPHGVKTAYPSDRYPTESRHRQACSSTGASRKFRVVMHWNDLVDPHAL
jgi:hypothetical protein